MSLTRLPNWESLLAKFLSSRRTAPYAWGTNDCCTFSADAIQAMTGTDIAADFRGYTDEVGAYAAIKKVCNGVSASDAVSYCATKYGLVERSNAKFASRGDLLLVSNAGTIIVGILDTHGKASCVTDKGLAQFPISDITAAYQV